MSIAVPFPEELPEGYQWLSDEPPFDPERHLSLESPSETLSLEDLGYSPEEIQDKATAFGVSEPFRILSKEGSEVMLETARRLRIYSRRDRKHGSRWMLPISMVEGSLHQPGCERSDGIHLSNRNLTPHHAGSPGAPELSAQQTGRGCG